MRRKVLGYSKVIDELKNGNCIFTAPYSNAWMVIEDELCTVRKDFFDKAWRNGFSFKYCYVGNSYV